MARLKPRDFVVIKTTKDDKYKRMLVDVFYDAKRHPERSEGSQKEQWSPEKVAAEGKLLN